MAKTTGASKTNQRSKVRFITRYLPRRPQLLMTLLAAIGLHFGGYAYALPTGAQVASGNVTPVSYTHLTLPTKRIV